VTVREATGRQRKASSTLESVAAVSSHLGPLFSAALSFAQSMAPRTRPAVAAASARVKLAPKDERHLLAAVEHAARGETLALTPEETVRYCETGELPERVARWTASHD
jgi:hypothetical protein